MPVTVTDGKARLKAGWDIARARIIADFRAFRFTWGGFFKWSGITLLAVLIAAIVTLYFLDWNQMRGPLSRYLSSRTGREVRIEGNLAVKLFSWQPSLEVGEVFIGNPSWVGTPQAARFSHARVDVRLVPLLFGNLILPLVQIDSPDLLVIRDASGRTNWDSKGGQDANAAFKLPPIRRFVISNGHVEIRDAVRKLHFTGSVSSTEEAGRKRASFALTGDGTLNQNKFLANVQGGPLLNVDQSKPYNFNADIHAGATHAVVNGAITEPFHLDRFTANINVNGPDLSDLYFLTGLVLPKTPAYRMTVSVQREGSFYRLNDINATLGSTDLAGNLTVDVSKPVPALAGKVASRSLNFADLGPMFGGGKAQPVTGKYLLPDTALHTERLKQTNAEVDYSAASIKSRDFPLTSLDTHISVKDAVLNLNPLAFGFTQGKLSGTLKVDARTDVPVTSVDARLTDLRAENFIKGADKPVQGLLEARAVLTGRGTSVHKVAASADGTVTAVVPQGGMRHSLAEWLGIDVLKALSLNLGDDNSNTQLRCAVAGFGVKTGMMTAQSFVLDTEPVRVDGSGRINLADETLNLRLQGAPKHFQLVRLRAPITVTGSLAHPAIGVDPTQAIAQGGVALALGLVNPLAAILAFVDPGLAKDANCGPLLANAKAKGAPVKASAVRNAPAPRK